MQIFNPEGAEVYEKFLQTLYLTVCNVLLINLL
jgi:hypothetical protein